MHYVTTSSGRVRTFRVETGLFDGTNMVVLIEGFGASAEYLSKIIITNTDTANITPKVRLHNTDKTGEDDEYIQMMPEITLAPNERFVYDSPVFFLANQDLEIELSAAVATSEPQFMMVLNNV